MCRSVTLAAVLLAATCLAGVPAGAGADERILSYHTDIVVAKDSTITVTETIKVRAERKKIKHGIYRDLPTGYTPGDGRTRMGYKVLKVLRDGKVEAWHTGNGKPGFLRIYMGKKNVVLKKGVYTYAITYRPTHTVLNFFEKYDELYWNVTGNGWEFSIDKASATVAFPVVIDPNDITHDAYTGRKGAKGKDCKSEIDPQGKVQFRMTRKLKKGEGLTIVTTFPKGVCVPPKPDEEPDEFLVGRNYCQFMEQFAEIEIATERQTPKVELGRNGSAGP